MKRPRKIASSTASFLTQIPAEDRRILLELESIWDIHFKILWTRTGWRYQFLP